MTPPSTAASAPADAEASAVFEALETARVEALGARAMDGVRGNLDILAEARIRSDAIGRARTAEEVPLATAVGLIARQRLTGAEPPAAAREGLKLVADWIEEKAGAELDALALTIDDQQAYATLSRRLLEDLDLETAADPSERGAGGRRRGRGGRRAGLRRKRRQRRRSQRRRRRDGDAPRGAGGRRGFAERRGRSRWRGNLGRRGGQRQRPAALRAPQLGRRAGDRLQGLHHPLRRNRRGRGIVRRRRAWPAARLSRPADGPDAGRRHPPRQPAAAAADGAAGAQLGLRPGGRAARRRPGWRGSSSRPTIR